MYRLRRCLLWSAVGVVIVAAPVIAAEIKDDRPSLVPAESAIWSCKPACAALPQSGVYRAMTRIPGVFEEVFVGKPAGGERTATDSDEKKERRCLRTRIAARTAIFRSPKPKCEGDCAREDAAGAPACEPCAAEGTSDCACAEGRRARRAERAEHRARGETAEGGERAERHERGERTDHGQRGHSGDGEHARGEGRQRHEHANRDDRRERAERAERREGDERDRSGSARETFTNIFENYIRPAVSQAALTAVMQGDLRPQGSIMLRREIGAGFDVELSLSLLPSQTTEASGPGRAVATPEGPLAATGPGPVVGVTPVAPPALVPPPAPMVPPPVAAPQAFPTVPFEGPAPIAPPVSAPSHQQVSGEEVSSTVEQLRALSERLEIQCLAEEAQHLRAIAEQLSRRACEGGVCPVLVPPPGMVRVETPNRVVIAPGAPCLAVPGRPIAVFPHPIPSDCGSEASQAGQLHRLHEAMAMRIRELECQVQALRALMAGQRAAAEQPGSIRQSSGVAAGQPRIVGPGGRTFRLLPVPRIKPQAAAWPEMVPHRVFIVPGNKPVRRPHVFGARRSGECGESCEGRCAPGGRAKDERNVRRAGIIGLAPERITRLRKIWRRAWYVPGPVAAETRDAGEFIIKTAGAGRIPGTWERVIFDAIQSDVFFASEI